jgi:hypothetical protein
MAAAQPAAGTALSRAAIKAIGSDMRASRKLARPNHALQGAALLLVIAGGAAASAVVVSQVADDNSSNSP